MCVLQCVILNDDHQDQDHNFGGGVVGLYSWKVWITLSTSITQQLLRM